MGVFGSIGINVGQNMQAGGIAKLPDEDKMKPHKSRMWIQGMIVFVSFSMLNFAALALAPASILTPLESIQFVTSARARWESAWPSRRGSAAHLARL